MPEGTIANEAVRALAGAAALFDSHEVASPRRRRLWRTNGLVVSGGALLIAIVVAVLLAPVISPFGPSTPDFNAVLAHPTTKHLFGTDQFGRDMLSRVLIGGRISLSVGLLSTICGGLVGTVLGGAAGFIGGWLDQIVMRLMDVFLSFPTIVLAIAVAAIFGPSFRNVVLIIGFLFVPQFARVARGAAAQINRRDFVIAARALGVRRRTIFRTHVVPNMAGPLIALVSVTIPSAILAESALSFLGVGVNPTGTPSWGSLLADGKTYLLVDPWYATFPGIALTITVMGFNLVSDGLRDVFDVRSTAA